MLNIGTGRDHHAAPLQVAGKVVDDVVDDDGDDTHAETAPHGHPDAVAVAAAAVSILVLHAVRVACSADAAAPLVSYSSFHSVALALAQTSWDLVPVKGQ